MKHLLLFLLGAVTAAAASWVGEQPRPGDSPLVRDGPAVTLVAAAAWAGSSVNMLANQSNTLITDGATQYAAFYSADHHLMLARRPLGTDTWTVQKTPYTGNVTDAHNTVAIAVDGEGYLHVAWDHHAQPLNYVRSVAPGSLELGPKQPMTGTLERSVTYPLFYRQPDGGLLFLYRDGRSGQGNVVLKHYDLKQHAWEPVQENLIDGEGARSAYLAATIDPAGTLHLAWNWRESADVATNHDLCYAQSADGGVTWTTSTGTPLTLPLTAATAEYALRIPQNSRMMNPPGLATDAAGHPCITTYWAPAGSDIPQFHLVRHDGHAWSVTQITSRTAPFELRGTATKRPPISRGAILTRESAAGRQEFYLIYRDDERGGKITAVSCADLAHPAWRVRELYPDSVGAWEPSVDPVQWSQHGRIDLLVQRVEQLDGNDRQAAAVAPTPVSLLSWTP